MFDFYTSFFCLLLLATLILLSPLVFRRKNTRPDQLDLNLECGRQRLQELKQQLDSEQIAAAEYQQLRSELELQLAQEQGSNSMAAGLDSSKRQGGWLIGLAVLLLIVGSVYLYQQLGAKADVEIKQQLQQLANKSKPTAKELKTLQAAMNERIRQRPDNHHYRMLLAEMALQERDYQTAIKHFKVLVDTFPQDEQAQAYLTQAYYFAADEQITPEVQQQINHSLALAPKKSPTLNLLAMHAFKQGDYQTAILHWQTLLAVAPPQSRQYQMLQQGIAAAKLRLGQTAASKTQEVAPEKSHMPTISVRVEAQEAALKAALKDSQAMVFIIIKAVSGPPMPLAVKRLPLTQLPADISLSDADAMLPSLKLSQFKALKINARISRQAKAQVGDWQSGWQNFELKGGLQLVLDIKQQL